jgi:WD40 repeat protein
MPVAWSPDGTRVAVVERTAIHIWDAAGTPITMCVGHEASVATVTWSPDGNLLTSGGWDSTIRFWSPHGTLLHTLDTWSSRRSVGTPFELAWSSNGASLAASLRTGTVHTWGILV